MNGPPSDPEIDARAAEWFGRREGGLSPAQEQEFQRWLAADRRHAAHYGQFDETWLLLAELKDRLPVEAGVASIPQGPRFPHRWWPAFAAAAALALGFFLWPRSNPQFARYAIATEAAGMKKLELPDGSVVRLNADTEVAVELTPGERRVDLRRGEAHFTVAKDSSRPFVVNVAGMSVRAIGTAFNVALKSSRLEVFVTEGKVHVEENAGGQSVLPQPADSKPVLTAGQKVVVDLALSRVPDASTVLTMSASEVEQALAWQIKLLEFDQKRLSDVIAEFNRYNQHQLVIADEALARRTFGGTFRADNYEDLVNLLETRFGVVAERSGNQTVLRLRR
ncbi:MAG: anti-FecI sigma factor, FecR [Verrucomicrobia bacterium]|nr:anti-FecI sigma factor, FecR [Verrucomicrobiota bacterium]